ncbi:hypothetical protein MNBD_NITROSPINAE03-1883, partial [hydrothermal vent metagenome]
MSQELFTTLSIKVSLIPEEGIARKWVIDPENFKGGLSQIAAERPVEVAGRLYRVETTVYFDGKVDATIKLDCSRCLETFSFGVSGEVSAVFMPEVEGTGEEP